MPTLRRQLQDMQQERDNYRAMWEGLNEEIQKGKKSKPAELHDAGDRIIMDISIEEAMTLQLMLCFVGGCPEKSPRKHADSLLEALRKLGIDHPWEKAGALFGPKGDIGFYFKDGGDIQSVVRWNRSEGK